MVGKSGFTCQVEKGAHPRLINNITKHLDLNSTLISLRLMLLLLSYGLKDRVWDPSGVRVESAQQRPQGILILRHPGPLVLQVLYSEGPQTLWLQELDLRSWTSQTPAAQGAWGLIVESLPLPLSRLLLPPRLPCCPSRALKLSIPRKLYPREGVIGGEFCIVPLTPMHLAWSPFHHVPLGGGLQAALNRLMFNQPSQQPGCLAISTEHTEASPLLALFILAQGWCSPDLRGGWRGHFQYFLLASLCPWNAP